MSRMFNALRWSVTVRAVFGVMVVVVPVLAWWGSAEPEDVRFPAALATRQLGAPASWAELTAQGLVEDAHYTRVDLGRVSGVVDGDTFDVGGAIALFGETTGVRLYGVDTPERGAAGYEEAKSFLAAMLGDASSAVLVRGPRATGPYGRTLRYVFTVMVRCSQTRCKKSPECYPNSRSLYPHVIHGAL